MLKKLVGSNNLHDKVVSASFWGIQKLVMAVSFPSWLGAYEKAIDEGMTTVDAVDYADGIVARGQGSGLPRNLSDIQQGPLWRRMFTMFYTFFNAYYNVQTDMVKELKREGGFKNPQAALKYAKNQIWVTVIPSLLVDALFNGGPEDDEEWYSWAATTLTGFAAGGVVGLRDAVNAATTGFGFQVTPAGGIAKNAISLGQQIAQGEADTALWKALIMSSGYAFHIPGARTAARATDVISDEGTKNLDTFEGWWRVLVQGKEK